MGSKSCVGYLENLPVHAHRLDEAAGQEKRQRLRLADVDPRLQCRRPSRPSPVGQITEQATTYALASPLRGDQEIHPELAGPDLPPGPVPDDELRRASGGCDAQAGRPGRIGGPPPSRGEQRGYAWLVRGLRRTDERAASRAISSAHSSDYASAIWLATKPLRAHPGSAARPRAHQHRPAGIAQRRTTSRRAAQQLTWLFCLVSAIPGGWLAWRE